MGDVGGTIGKALRLYYTHFFINSCHLAYTPFMIARYIWLHFTPQPALSGYILLVQVTCVCVCVCKHVH
ncbi:hypothetical protein FKM82_009704 [Ascaphus truei]